MGDPQQLPQLGGLLGVQRHAGLGEPADAFAPRLMLQFQTLMLGGVDEHHGDSLIGRLTGEDGQEGPIFHQSTENTGLGKLTEIASQSNSPATARQSGPGSLAPCTLGLGT